MINKGLAIVCMVNNTAIKNHNKTNDFDLMPQSRISFGNDSVCKFQPKNDTQVYFFLMTKIIYIINFFHIF
jgi:hypothetical protein